MQDKIPYTVIANFLSGEASSDEVAMLNSWRQLSVENEITFQQYREIWTMVSASNDAVMPDKEDVWEKLTAQIEIKQKPRSMYTRSFMLRVASIAAAITLIIGFSLSTFIPFNTTPFQNEISVHTPRGQKSELNLPDGTSVWLNSGSTLTYNTGYGIKNRTVKLEGEAFFDVTHDKKKTFEVVTGTIKTQVHGTAFGIKAFKEDSSIDISLLRGHVTVHSLDSDRILADLIPNHKAVIEKSTLLSHIEKCNTETENIWRYGKLKVEGETIKEVVRMMSRWYGVNISIHGKVQDEKYWFTIKTESLTEMLMLINQITPIQFSINGEEVAIQI